jgi:geranylgeranyl reductase family protein
MKTLDAVIVGAGPAGSAAAIALARTGYEVALIDKQIFPREKLCGDFVNPVNRAIFRDLGVEEQVLAQPHGTVTRFRITASSGRAAEVAFADGELGTEPGLGLRRAYLDQVLVQRAAALGAAIYQGQRIDKFGRAAGGWRLTTAGGETWQAKMVIGADGRNSWVARQLGLDRRAVPAGRAVGFQSRLRFSAATNDKIEIHLFPGGYAGVVALGDGTINLGMAIDKRRLDGNHGSEFLFDHVLARNPHLKAILGRRVGPAEVRSVYPVYFPARRPVTDGALLAGDAARVSEPVTGEGIYFAMRSGLLAAKSADRAFRTGNLTASGLAGYERACRRAFRSRLALNALLRCAVYRPALIEPIIRLSARNQRLLHSLINAVCMP